MNPKVQMIINFMNANLHRKLSSDKLANSIEISRSHLCHLFKTETGMPAGQYLQMLRMQKAARLLAATLMSVKQIMVEVGYGDKAHFTHHFKKVYGLTPSAYRAGHMALNLSKEDVARQDRHTGMS
jgi:transcriptional regulator GlxA family with amidase domain